MPRVIISSAHTTKNPGQVFGALREVDITRKIALETVNLLRRNGILTLSTPKELETDEKIDWINRTGYKSEFRDLCLEIQLSKGNGTKSGAVAWFGGKNQDESKELAKGVLVEVEKESGLKNLGEFSESTHPEKRLKYLHETHPTAVIIGSGFIDNSSDQEFLKNDDNLKKISKGIAKGITTFLKIEYKEAPALNPKPVNNFQTLQSRPTQPSTPQMQPSVGFGNSFDDGGFSSFNKPATPGGSNSYLASREERKEMIKKNYIKLLGREPSQSDLNYFLNTGISEDQLIKKMVDSQEHVDLVKARQEVLITKAQFHGQQAEILQLRAENADKAGLINNLNALISQKNIALTEQHRKLQTFSTTDSGLNNSDNQPKPAYKKSLSDRLFGFFSDRLG